MKFAALNFEDVFTAKKEKKIIYEACYSKEEKFKLAKNDSMRRGKIIKDSSKANKRSTGMVRDRMMKS